MKVAINSSLLFLLKNKMNFTLPWTRVRFYFMILWHSILGHGWGSSIVCKNKKSQKTSSGGPLLFFSRLKMKFLGVRVDYSHQPVKTVSCAFLLALFSVCLFVWSCSIVLVLINCNYCVAIIIVTDVVSIIRWLFSSDRERKSVDLGE